MAVLVTGVGYIGSRLVEVLLARGEEVTAIDNFFSTDRRAVARLRRSSSFRFLRGDVTNPKLLRQALSGPVDKVFSLAAQSSAHPQAASAAYTERTNLMGPRLLLDAMLEHGVRRLVFGSSLRVCGAELPSVVDESAPYGSFQDLSHLSKCYAEKLMEMYALRDGLDCVAVRLGVCYGVSPVTKEDPRFMTVPNKFCWQALRGEPLEVYSGGDQPLGFIHVADAAAALLEVSERANLRGYQVVNAASQVASVAELAQMVAWAARDRGMSVEVRGTTQAQRPTARVVSRLDGWGFVARHSLATGIAETLDYWGKKCG